MSRGPRPPRAPRVGPPPAVSSAARWAGWPASARWPFPAWGRSSPPARSWPPLGGAAVGAATGGLTGALVGYGIPELEAKQYEGKVKGGNILLSVHTEDRDQVSRVKEIFKRHNAEDIAYTGESSVPRAERAERA